MRVYENITNFCMFVYNIKSLCNINVENTNYFSMTDKFELKN